MQRVTIFPCKDCENHTVGCHSTCEKYLAARKLQDHYNKENEKEKYFEYLRYKKVKK